MSDSPALAIHALDDAAARDVWRAAQRFGLSSGHLFQTSGSSGRAKWIHLSHKAVEASCTAVNAALRSDASDVWLLALPTVHVGGAMIPHRAKLSGARVAHFHGKWDAREFLRALEVERATLTSLVPTQLYDLVQTGEQCPNSLRAVIIGGGALDDELANEARALGWPVHFTYGMTETASQVALGKDALILLPHVQARTTDEGVLELRGASLFDGHLLQDDAGKWNWETPFDGDGWFRTSDRAEIVGESLRILTIRGRVDRVVKVLGELVDLDAIEKATGLVVVTVPDERTGARLVAVGTEREPLESAVAAWNANCQGFQRLEARSVPDIPRTALGKVRRAVLQAMLMTTR